jgi:hypothetical protein
LKTVFPALINIYESNGFLYDYQRALKVFPTPAANWFGADEDAVENRMCFDLKSIPRDPNFTHYRNHLLAVCQGCTQKTSTFTILMHTEIKPDGDMWTLTDEPGGVSLHFETEGDAIRHAFAHSRPAEPSFHSWESSVNANTRMSEFSDFGL